MMKTRAILSKHLHSVWLLVEKYEAEAETETEAHKHNSSSTSVPVEPAGKSSCRLGERILNHQAMAGFGLGSNFTLF